MNLQRTLKDGNLQIFMSEDKSIVVKHYTVRRGGCLWIGEIMLLNRKTNKSFSFDSTFGPYAPESKLIPDNDSGTLRYFESLAKAYVC